MSRTSPWGPGPRAQSALSPWSKNPWRPGSAGRVSWPLSGPLSLTPKPPGTEGPGMVIGVKWETRQSARLVLAGSGEGHRPGPRGGQCGPHTRTAPLWDVLVGCGVLEARSPLSPAWGFSRRTRSQGRTGPSVSGQQRAVVRDQWSGFRPWREGRTFETRRQLVRSSQVP